MIPDFAQQSPISLACARRQEGAPRLLRRLLTSVLCGEKLWQSRSNSLELSPPIRLTVHSDPFPPLRKKESP
jgi:hypothetical protein